jgi:histidine ammonia-lyase
LSSKKRRKHSKVILDGVSLTIDQILEISREFAKVSISEEATANVKKGRRIVEQIIESGGTAYGVNTGFGKLAEQKIDSKDLDLLQLNLVRSHAAGVGEPLDSEEVRAIMAVRLNTLLRGYSGVRMEVIDQLVSFLNSNVTPVIPRFGSLGASGDLAPSAHLALSMIGEGEVFFKGSRMPAKKFFEGSRLHPIRLKEKEGLAIINGTQVMSGLGSLIIHDVSNFLENLDIAAAVSLEALGGNLDQFDRQVHELRPVEGQIQVADHLKQLVSGSQLLGRGRRTQDPYSLRCIPQVHGAFREAFRFATSLMETEINSVTDNPLIFPDGSVISAGNFHGQPIAVALDLLGIILAEAGAFSERRIDKLLSAFTRDLPLFLSKNSGLHSGLMILQYTAAALVNQTIVLASPAGLHSAEVSAGQEDHASMGVTSALKAREILSHVNRILAIELLCGCQALDLIPNKRPGHGSETVYGKVRNLSKFVESDRSLSEDIERLSQFLAAGGLKEAVNHLLVKQNF